MTTNKSIITTPIDSSSRINSILFQPNGEFVLAGFSGAYPNYLFSLSRYNSDGSLDISFNSNGSVATPLGLSSDTYLVTFQSDGKLVVAGTSHDGLGNADFALFRYNSDGSMDGSFGNAGTVTTNLGDFSSYYNSDDIIQSVTPQANGKLLVAGTTYNSNGNADFALVRYNSDGSLDNSFGNAGTVITNLGDFSSNFNSNDIIQSVTAQANGKLLVAGTTYNSNGNADFALVRYNSDGSLDYSFGNGSGTVVTNVGDFLGYYNSDDIIQSVTTQANGKLLVAGTTYNSNGNADFALVCYNSDGSLDYSFGNGSGIVVTNVGDFTGFSNSNDVVQSVMIQPNGKLLVTGTTYNSNGNADFALVRYNSDGSLDNSFNGNGVVATDFNSSDDFLYSVTAQLNGKLIATGFSYDSMGHVDFSLVHYNSDGSLDTKFDSGINHEPEGIVTINDTTPEEKQQLIASNTLSDVDGLGVIDYSWLVNGFIVGTGNKYTVTTTDIGKNISVVASYTDGLGHPESVISAVTSTVTAITNLTLNGTIGNDVLNGNSGNDLLNGNAGNDKLNGSAGNDTINGGSGNDVLKGSVGNDTLTGGAGKDIFIFNAAFKTAGVDTITDFNRVDDTIKLENAIFKVLTSIGVLNAASFVTGNAAVDNNDYVIYNPTTGALFYDADGNGTGTAVQIAVIGTTTHPTLTAADFMVI